MKWKSLKAIGELNETKFVLWKDKWNQPIFSQTHQEKRENLNK